MKDLFGEQIVSGDVVRQRGHAAQPGTGPAGETCRTCLHYWSIEHGTTTVRKCHLMRDHWHCGSAAEIRAKDAAYRLWEAK